MRSDKTFFVIQSLIKYISFGWGVKLRAALYRPYFKAFGKNINIKDGVTFKYPSEIELGDNCTIGEYSYLVGKNGLKIGNDFLMGAGSKIITSNHNYAQTDIPINRQGLSFKPVVIGNDVWLGFDVKILCGTVVGDGNIIGTGAVVSGDFSGAYNIIAGIPARVIKSRKPETDNG